MKFFIFLCITTLSPQLFASQLIFSGHGVDYSLDKSNQMISFQRGRALYSDKITSCNKEAYDEFWQGLKFRFKKEKFVKNGKKKLPRIEVNKKLHHLPSWSKNLSFFLKLEKHFIYLLTVQKRKCA